MPRLLGFTSFDPGFAKGARFRLSGFRPYFSLSQEAQQQALQDTAFADGLRGIAALFVVSSHLVLCYATALVNACCAPNSESPYLFQRPILRLPANGHTWVAIFFLLLGFVNALKPIKLARSGQPDLASSNLARGAFGRTCRLILPASLVTTISWVLCQFKLYETARFSDAFWLNATSPAPSRDGFAALTDLKNALRDTWMFGRDSRYDQPQWAMIHLLQGSMMVITVLLLTINMTSRWRIVSLMIIIYWSLDWSRQLRDPWVGPTCFTGVLLAEFSLSTIPSRLAPYSRVLTPPLAVFSLVLMSYTQHAPKLQSWSRVLHSFGTEYLPGDAEDSLDRTYGGIGGALLLASIIISPHARFALSRKPLKRLGKISFAIYLIHGTILRTVFSWILFFGQDLQEFVEQDQHGFVHSEWKYVVAGAPHCAFATGFSVVVILFASHMWSIKVEPVLAKITTNLEKIVTGGLSHQNLGCMLRKGEEEKMSLLPVARVRQKGDRIATDWEIAQQAKERQAAAERQGLVTS